MMTPLYLALFVPLACAGLLAFGRVRGGKLAWLLAVSVLFLVTVQPRTWYLTVLLAVLAWIAPLLGRVGAALYTALAVGMLFVVKLAGGIWPVGLSFVVIQGVSYVMDAAGNRERRGSLPEALVYMFFFPKLSAGPVSRFPAFREQLQTAYVSWEGLEAGFLRLAFGLGKKLLIADSLYPLAMAAFSGAAHPLAWGISLAACALYVYFDFAGCTDAALGVGQMLGIRLPENFDHPFRAVSLRDFWRRWHMSLSGFFRDYVYIPLGGSRCGRLCTLRNVAVVFLLMGVWHGFTWGYLLFGAWHAALMMLEHAGVLQPERWKKPLARLYTLSVVSVGFVIFMSAGPLTLDVSYAALRQAVMLLSPMGMAAFTAAAALLLLEGARPLPAWAARLLALVLLALAWMQLLSGSYMPMLYASF